MSKYKFIAYEDNGSKTIKVFEEDALYNILPEIESFLRGAGFSFKGSLDIVEDTEE